MSATTCPGRPRRIPSEDIGAWGAMTITTAKRSSMKRHVREVASHNCKKRVTVPTNALLRNLSLGVPQRSGAPCTKRGRMQTTSAWPAGITPISPPYFSISSVYSPGCRDLFIFLRDKLICIVYQEGRATATGWQRLLIPYDRPGDDLQHRPAPYRIPGALITK